MKGQTLFEIIIALAIFSMIASILVSVSLGGFTALTQGGDHTKASALAEESMEVLRSIRDGAWNTMPNTNTTDILGKFTRTITLEAVCRDASRVIVTCQAGATDPHTTRATVKVSWETRPGVSNTVTRSSYITSWDSKTWTQTDWLSVVGQTSDGNLDLTGGEIKLRRNSGWVKDASITTQILNSIDADSKTNVWAVGNNGIILKHNGNSWSSNTFGISNINAVDVVSSNDIWVAGSAGKIYHYNGSAWSEDTDTGTQTWNSISMVSQTLGFAVGNGGFISKYNGTGWTTSKIILGYTEDLSDVRMLSATDGWVAGSAGKIYHYNGSAWSEDTDTGTNKWNSISMVSQTLGFAVGDGGFISKYNGTGWTTSKIIPNHIVNLNEVRMLSATDGWAVDNGGKTFFWNGISWTNLVSPVTVPLNSLVLVGDIGWAVGSGGTILKLNRDTVQKDGYLISSAFDLTDNSPVESIEWDEVIPSACDGTCSVKLQIQTSTDGASWFPLQWMGPDGNDGDETDYFTKATGYLIPQIANGKKWVRYKTVLNGDGANTPVLKEVRIQYK